MNTTNKIRERRQVIYNVLKQNLPIKMNASGIVREINRLKIFQYPVSASQVSYAIRDYALRSKCFSVFFQGKRVLYSVYK